MRRSLLLLALFTLAAAAAGQSATMVVMPLIEKGTAALNDRDWAAADTAFRAALDAATAQNDQLWQFRSWFYLGVTRQAEAELEGDATRKKTLLEQSKEPYRRALALRPTSAATLSNLAEAEWNTGNRAAAIALLERGLELGKGEFATRLAEAYRLLGDREKAARYLTAAAAQDDSTTHELAMKVLLGENEHEKPLGAPLVGYLWTVVESLDVDRGLDGCLRALDHPALAPETTRGVLTVLAVALAEKDYDLAGFRGSTVGERILKIVAGEPSIRRDALAAVVMLYRADIGNRAPFAVWNDERKVEGDSDVPTPLTAFRELVRSLAAIAERQQLIERAKTYYRLAIDLAPDRVDPGAVRGLAGIYAAQNDLKNLGTLAAAYERKLDELEAKTIEEVEDIYEFYRLIARTYTTLPPNSPMRKSAVEALEHARISGKTNVEPELYAQLATVYAKEGDLEKSKTQRLAAASAYFDEGDFTRAREELALLGEPPAAYGAQLRYAELVDELVVLPDNVSEILPADKFLAVKRDLLLLSSKVRSLERAKAEAELRSFGITVDTLALRMQYRVNDVVRKGAFYLPTHPSPSMATAAAAAQ